MKKRKFVAILSLLITISVFPGCSGSENKTSSKAQNYNLALISNFSGLPQYTNKTIELTTYNESDPNPWGERIHATDNTTVYTWGGNNDHTNIYPISSWEYGDSDTIILYLMNGNVIQTSSENVLLYYDPNY